MAIVMSAICLWLMQSLNFFQVDLVHQLKVIDQLKSQIDQLWFRGDEMDYGMKKKLNNCQGLNIEQLDPEFFKCNDLLLKCFLQEQSKHLQKYAIDLVEHTTGDPFHLQSASQMYANSFHQIDGVKIEFAFKNEKIENLALLLERNCHEKKLPEKIYKVTIKPDWYWDNFGREIMLDKFLTNQMLVGQWSKHNQINLSHIDLSQPDKTAVGLNLWEQRQFCEFRGGRIIDLLTYEAMIFYPTSWDDPTLKSIKFYPYPWGRSARVNPFKNSTQPDPSDCSLLFSKNCKTRFNYNSWESNNISWMGTYQILGGPLETVENPFGKTMVKLSSYYFHHNSDHQKNGEYAYWNGRQFKQLELTPLKLSGRVNQADRIESQQMLDIGFRCIREY
jgi:hypothetical protein